MLERGVFNLGFLLKRTSPQSLHSNSEPEQPVKATEDITEATPNKKQQNINISHRPRANSEITIDTNYTTADIPEEIERAKGILKEKRFRQTGIRTTWCCRCMKTVIFDDRQWCTEENCKHQRCYKCRAYDKPEGETLQTTNLSPVEAAPSVI